MKVRTVILLVSLMLVLLVSSGVAQYPALVPLPANLQGELNGQSYRVRVPANWNGTLLVYSYGYAEGYNLVPLTPLGTNTAGPDEQMLLSKGYALAGIRAAGSVTIPGGMAAAGFNMKDRLQNTAGLTATLREMVGQPKHTIAWGKSMGGLVSIGLIEKFPGLFDGAVPLCAPAAGTPRMFDQKFDIVLTYSVVFGWKDEWGTPNNLRSDLNVMTEVAPHVAQQLTPDKLWKWEFLRRLNRLPADTSFYSAVPPFTQAPFLFQVIWLSFAPQSDLYQRAGGHAAENIGRVYTLSPDDKSAIIALGGDPEPLLAAMNAKAIYASDHNARNYVEHYYNPTGRITRPVITIHTTGDAAANPNNEAAYRELVDKHGALDLLMQEFTTGNGFLNTHCTFAPVQYMNGIDAMVHWLDTGTKPDPAVYFPESLGFDSDFVPDAWPW